MADPEERSDSDAAAGSPPAGLPLRNEQPISGTPTDSGVSETSAKIDAAEITGQYFFPVPGDKLGKYEIQSVLGHGGMGVVFQAWDPDLQRSVAIKILGPQLALSRTARRRFLREARAAASINHPNVLTVHAVEQHEQFPFMVMERVIGQTLKNYLAQHGPLDSIEAIRLSHQIALGLAAAHAQGVIHRDVKPGNVMLDKGGTRVRLTDFGLARAVMDNLELTSQDHAVGTPAYMSPEQVRGDKLDARSDLFGFGCLIYFMFTRHSPFQGRVTAETWERVLHEQPPRLDAVNPAAPPLLAELALRLLQKNPVDRYQSAAEVARELERLLILLNQASSDQIESILRDTHATAKPQVATPAFTRPRQLVLGGVLLLLVTSLAASQLLPGSNLSMFRSDRTEAAPTDQAQQSLPVLEQSKLHAIRVGSDAQSDCKSITEAIQRAAQPCVITVAGPGPYYESVDIVGAAFDGLRLMADSTVIWSCPAGQTSPPLHLANVSDVTVNGFDFRIQAAGAHGVEITGTAENVLFEQCTFEHTATLPKLSLLWIAAGTGDWEKRLQVKNCYFHAAGRNSSCISISNGPIEGSRVEIVNCRFTALTTHLHVANSCHQLRVVSCIFDGGKNAVNLSLLDPARDYPFEISNNTFVNVKYWLGLMNSFRGGRVWSSSGGAIVNNLILGGERAQGGDDQYQHLLTHWQLESNWWERGSTTRHNADRDGQLATLVDSVDLVQRSDADAPGYLVPAPDSPLASSGVGGQWPSYVGAIPPAPSPSPQQ